MQTIRRNAIACLALIFSLVSLGLAVSRSFVSGPRGRAGAASVIPGPRGIAGPQGARGPAGPRGLPGATGTSVDGVGATTEQGEEGEEAKTKVEDLCSAIENASGKELSSVALEGC